MKDTLEGRGRARKILMLVLFVIDEGGILRAVSGEKKKRKRRGKKNKNKNKE